MRGEGSQLGSYGGGNHSGECDAVQVGAFLSDCGSCGFGYQLAKNEVLNSVRLAGLASEVARLNARFLIKDSDDSLKGAA